MKPIRVGLVGSGFVAELHMHAYRRVYGVNASVEAVVSRGDHVVDFAVRHHIPNVYRDYRDLLKNKEIDVVDICTPAVVHAPMIVEAMESGKQVICEKPFTGYFGQVGDPTPIGRKLPKSLMYERVMEEMTDTRRRMNASGSMFMYAENWVYAPAVAKSAEILRKTKDKVLFMKAEESHSGSHADHAARWDMTGGGALIRQGCHPLSAVLYLKKVESRARNEKIGIADVAADVGNIGDGLSAEEHKYILSHPVDVEDWAMMNLTFTDGTKSTVFAGDMILGGVRNLVETYTTGGILNANMCPNTGMVSYLTDESKLQDVYITEKVDRKTGWQYVCLEEEWTRGYIQEIQDFMECVAYGRKPLADLELAYDTIQAIYAAYWAAEDGKRIKL
ncbi:MAG: Gfo/Idh/MocA family protein [Negativicutes bacterium]